MPTACTILVDQLDDGRYRATCSLLPDYEILAESEEAARTAMQEAIGLSVSGQVNSPPQV